ncbi:hypothetical protein [Chryseobacterium indoltheticum]|uniref:hypothetical protein n=1 Tax=Chryseobacterium indoltheticum TaxID=254 RepID=UPI00191292DF|nr:hypothetical protein [Chryseobacterium indoltheticum]QQQ28297.1 hypothetical protein JJL46_19865 [Chryseobacterium indoltheticum]
MIAPEYFNNHVAVEGEIIVKSVPNEAGFVLVWNPTTKKISRRTHTEIVSDLNLVTSNQLGNYWQRYNGSSWNEIRSDKAVVILDELGNQAQNIYTGGLLVSNVYADSSNIPTNGIYSKGNIATLNYGSASDWNAKVSQSQLNDYVTLNTEQNIEGAKWFKTIGGNQYLNHRLRIISEDNSNPGMVFYKSGVNVGTIQYDGSNYLFTTSDTNAFANLVSAGFIKEGSNNGYALLGGGGHKPLSDFALINHTHSFLQSTATGEADLNNLINDYTFNYYPVIYPTSTNLFPNAVDNANGLISISTHPDYGVQLGINTYGDIYKRALQNGNFSGWSKIITSTDSDNYVTINTPQWIIADKNFALTSNVSFYGNEQNQVDIWKTSSSINSIVSGHIYHFYNTRWKVGNKRGGSSDSLGYAFQFSSDGGANYSEQVLIQPDGNILTSNFGSASDWNAKVDQSQLAGYVKTTGDQSIDGIKGFTGAYTQWILDGDSANARGFVQPTPNEFLLGTLNNKNVSIYRNSIEKIVVEDLLTTFRTNISVPNAIQNDHAVNLGQLANYQPLGQYVRVGGTGTTGNNILLGWTGSQLQATVDATTIGNLWHSGNLNPSNFLQNDKIASKSIGVVATTLDAELPNGGFISSYYSSSWAGTDRPDGASYGGYIKFSEVGGDNNNLDFYYNNGHNGDVSRLWFRTKESVNGVKSWMELWHTGNFNPSNFFSNDGTNTLKAIDASNYNDVVDGNGKIWLGNFYSLPTSTTGFQNSIGTILNINGLAGHDKTQLIFNGGNGNIQYKTSWYQNTPWSPVRTLWDDNNLPNPVNQSQLANYVSKSGDTMTGTLNLNATNNHLQFSENGVGKWHIESSGGEFNLVETGVAQRFRITPNASTPTYNNYGLWHEGNFNPNNYLPLSGGTLTGGGRISEQGVITIQQASTLNATGLFWEKMDDSDFMAGIGALTTGDNFAHVYMGWGLTPWAFANSLAVGENAFRYKDNQVWHAGIFNPDLYLTIRGGQDTALIAKTDFPLSITDYAGDPALTNFQSYYGTSFHFKGGNTWYNRLDFPTTADNLFLYQGINTTDMSLRGYIPIIDINAINWTSLNFSPDSKVSKSGDTMAGALRIGNTNIGKQRVLHLAEPTLLDSYGFDFYTDTNTGLLTLHSLNNGLNNSAPILSANRANNFVGINKENPTTELDVNGNITSNGFIKNNSSDDYFLMGGGGQLTKYSKDDAFVNSYRDFTDGTLITTNIDYSQTQGESFLLEIKGNMYGGGIPMDTKVQGYIYADTIINQSGYSTYSDLTTIIAVNINGNLCFWFPRLWYWQGFSVKAITTGGGGQTTVNRVVSIDNSAEPVGTKQVKIAIYTLSTQNWVNNQGFLTSANLNGYVTQSALNAQLGSYSTLNGVQTFANTNTFLQSPVIPNGTIGVHAVSLNQLLDVAPPYHWNYVGHSAIANRRVLSEITWNNYGNGHTIFDISSGTTPWGASKSNVDAEFQWNPSYPTLVGGNGSGTYGVRVDSARNADNLGGIPAGNYATQTWVDSNFISQSHPVNNITQANINSWNAAAGGSSHTHSNLSYLNNIDQYLGTGQAPQFSSVRLMNSIGYGTLALEEDYIGGEAGLVDLSNEVFYAGRINEYIKYGSSVNGFEGLNIHFDAKLLGIGREIGNDEDKVQLAGDLSVDTVDIHNTSMQLILNPLYNTDGDVRRSRNAHIYIVTRETVRLPQKPILGQRIEIFNDSDSYIEVTHDNVGTMFKVPGFCKVTGIAANKGFKFDAKPVDTKQYDI